MLSTAPASLNIQSLQCVGIDEAGRGCLAGPVVAAALIIPSTFQLDSLPCAITDSKQLSAKQRLLLLPLIQAGTLFGIGYAWPRQIDQINILQATFTAMTRAVAALHHYARTRQSSIALSVSALPLFIDGNHTIPPQRWHRCAPHLTLPAQHAIIGGDAKNTAIAAASILAKTYRDALMLKLDARYPLYGFKKHMGYGTKQHITALEQHGACPLHRKTFNKVKPKETAQASLFDT